MRKIILIVLLGVIGCAANQDEEMLDTVIDEVENKSFFN